jgi:hypothetical protein
VLRVETTINDARFRFFRTPEGKPEADKSWHPMREGIADPRRRAETSQAANNRYLKALASVEDGTSLAELTAQLCQPVGRDGRRARQLNPHAPDDAQLFDAISRGEFIINGFRNRDPRELPFDPRLRRGRLANDLRADQWRHAANFAAWSGGSACTGRQRRSPFVATAITDARR